MSETTLAPGPRVVGPQRSVTPRTAPSDPAPGEARDGVGLTFREQMAGPFVFGRSDPREGASEGRRTGWRAVLHATVTVEDLARFADDPVHRGELRGELELPGVRRRIPFAGGLFALFAPSGRPGETLMRYEAPFTHEGRAYYLAGAKEVRNDYAGLDLWPDTTTLYTRLHSGPSADGPVVGAGILRLGVPELARLLASMRPVRADGPVDAVGAYARFAGFFAGSLVTDYLLQPRRPGPK